MIGAPDRVNGEAPDAFLGDARRRSGRKQVAPIEKVRHVELVRETPKPGKILHLLLKEVPWCACRSPAAPRDSAGLSAKFLVRNGIDSSRWRAFEANPAWSASA